MHIYEPKGRAREYSPLALNYFTGCDHGCIYCYVPKMMTRFRPEYRHEKVNTSVDFNKIEQSAKKHKGCNKQILLSFTGDPYCNAEAGETTKVLEILNHYGHKVAILTKNPGKALRDMELIKSFGERIKMGATLTSITPHISQYWEPNAPDGSTRINALKKFAVAGVKTWASFEPVYSPIESLLCLEAVAEFVNHIKVGKINNYNGVDKNIDWNDFLHDVVNICENNDLPFYIKKDLQEYKGGIHLTEDEINQDFLNL